MPVKFSEPEVRPLEDIDKSRRRMITPSDIVRGDHWLPRGYDQGSTDYWDSKALPLWIDDLVEHTANAGVNVEGILMKDTTITISIMTPGSVLFIGPGGLVSENTTKFFWDNAALELGIGTNAPNAEIEAKATDAEIRITDDTNDYYSRIVRTDADATRYAQTRSFITIGDALDCPIQTTYFDSGFMMGTDLGATDWEDFTVMFWAKPEFAVTEGGNVTGAGAQNLDGRFSVGFSGATDDWTLYIGGAGTTSFAGTNNAWVHFAIVFNSTTGIGTSYLNGVLADTFDFSAQAAAFQHLPFVETLYVGAIQNTGAIGKWKGLIDEFRIYNSQIAVADILAHVNGLTYETPAGPLLGYHFENDLTDWAGAYDGTGGINIGYGTGKIPEPTITDSEVWIAESGVVFGETGSIIFSNSTSRTTIRGDTIRFEIGGTEYATFDDSGYFNVDVINEYTTAAGVTIDGVLIKDSTVTTGTLTMAAGSITDTSGTIDFGNEILKTTGVMQAGDFAKTGWPTTPGVTLSFDNGNLRLTVIDGGSAYYYVDGVKYVLGGNKTVDITDTEGLWYFYFVGSTLTASQVVWDFTAEDKALGAYIYWDATNNKEITLGYELHNFIMDGSTHGRMHFGGGSAWDSGLLVSDAGAEDVNVSLGIMLDEDITIVITDGAGGGLWEQVLSPAELPIYYRDGASAWRKYETADKANLTDVGYVDGANDLHYNKLNGVWASTAAGVGKYVAYYAIASNDQTEPVALVMGQRIDTTFAAAKQNNIWSGLSLSGLPFEEMVILARLILKQTAGGLFYTLEEITDLRAFNAEGNITSPLITDHGGLGGLGDDDHAQYWIAGTVRTGNFATTGTLGIGTSTPDRAVEILDAANPQLRLTQADAAQYVDFQADSGASLIVTSIANQIMKVDVTPLHNIVIGKDAGISFTTGAYNLGIGRSTMTATTSGSNNTTIGALCFITNTIGYSNTALGVSSLYGNTTGYSNVGLGQTALYTNTVGYSNTAAGTGSLYFNTEGHGNTAVGLEALRDNTTASSNTAVGQNALRSNTIGTANAALGVNALYANTEGSYNTGAGVNSLRFNLTGARNVALGYAAGYYETGSDKLFIDNATRTNEADGRVKALVYGIFAAATVNQYFTVNGNFDVLENVALHGYVDLDEIAEPGNPAANVGRIYVMDDGGGTTTPYFKDSAGVKTSMIAAGGGVVDEIIDADSDTAVQVEAAADEDMIRFMLGGANDKLIICGVFTSTGINAAIDALGAEGGTVFLPEGTYTIDSVITIDQNNTSLIGGGWGTILDASAWSTDHVIDLNGVDNCRIADLQIEGQDGGANTKALIGDNATGASFCIFENLYLHHSDYAGIWIGAGSTNITIRNCTISNCDNMGLYLNGGVYNHIEGNTFGPSNNRGVFTGGACYYTEWTNNVAQANTLEGFYIQAAYQTIVGNDAVGNHDGIRTASVSTITGNCAHANAGVGFWLGGSYCSISGNTAFRSGNAHWDFYIVGSYNSFTGNAAWSLAGRSEYGLYVSGDYNEITGNDFLAHDTGGIYLAATATNNHVAWNNLEGEAVAKIINAGGATNTIVNAVAGVLTLPDAATLATSAAPTADAEIANKKYVDDTAGWSLLAEITVGAGGAASIDFTSIPATYTHLAILGNLRGVYSSTSDTFYMRFNNDSGNNYTYLYQYIQGDTAVPSPIGTRVATSIHIGAGQAATGEANSFSITEVEITNYTNTNMDTMSLSRMFMILDNSADNVLYLTRNGGHWNSTAAVTRITIFAAGGDIAEHSKLSLYGIK